MQISRIIAFVLVFASASFADSVSYTEDGIDFTLDVNDSVSGIVTAMLTMDTTNYVGSSSDGLHATGFKIFSSDQSSNASLIAAPGAESDWFFKAGGANNNTVHPNNNTTSPNSGFVTIIFDDPTGPSMDGSTYVFEVKFTTGASVIDDWSLKGITVKFDFNPLLVVPTTSKSEQWSSGGLTPGGQTTGGQTTGVPEPAAVLLLALGAIAVAARRRR